MDGLVRTLAGLGLGLALIFLAAPAGAEENEAVAGPVDVSTGDASGEGIWFCVQAFGMALCVPPAGQALLA